MEEKKSKPKKENVHKGHRERVRQKFIKDGGLENFQDHEILEFLLFYAYPMRDTNEMAHKLLNEYGSLYNLINTPPKSIANTTGITENAACLISLIHHANKRFLTSEFDKKCLTDSKKAGKYMKSLFNGQNYESLYLLCLNLKKKVLSCDEIDRGDSNSIRIDSRRILERALFVRAKYAIIAHNHPGGTKKPSAPDVSITRRLQDELASIGVILLDHIVAINDDYYSFSENRLMGLTYNPVKD